MPKKTDSLIVRVDPDQKRAFMAACEDQGTTASEAVRGFVERFVHEHGVSKLAKETAMTIRRNPTKSAAAAAALAAGLFAASTVPSAARDPIFAEWDANADGYIAPSELSCGVSPSRYSNNDALSFNSGCREVVAAMDADGNGAVDREEFTPIGRTHRTEDAVLLVNGEEVRRLRAFVIEWDASAPRGMNSGVASTDEVVPIDLPPARAEQTLSRLLREAGASADGATYPSDELNALGPRRVERRIERKTAND